MQLFMVTRTTSFLEAEFACTKHCYWILCFFAFTVTWHTHGACMGAHIETTVYIYIYKHTIHTYVHVC